MIKKIFDVLQNRIHPYFFIILITLSLFFLCRVTFQHHYKRYSHILPPAQRTQLTEHFLNMIVVLSLKEITKLRLPQIVLFNQLSRPRAHASVEAFTLRLLYPLCVYPAHLLKHKKRKPMKSGFKLRTRTAVLNNCIPLRDVTTFNVHHQPLSHFTQERFLSTQYIRICLKIDVGFFFAFD